MQKAVGVGRVQDCSDVNVTLGAGVDGYVLVYDNDTSKFVLSAAGTGRLQDSSDVDFSLGLGVDGYSVCWDNATSKFVLRLVTQGSCLLATGSVVGASSQAQAFTNGIKTGLVYPAADSTTSITLCRSDGATVVLNLDTTNRRIGVNSTPSYAFDVYCYTHNYMRFLRDGVDAADGSFFVTNATSGANKMAPIFWGKSNDAAYPGLWFLGDAKVDTGNIPILAFEARYANGLVSTRPILDISNYGAAGGVSSIIRVTAGGLLGIGTTAPGTKLDINVANSVTNAITNVLTIRHSSTGTPAAGFGVAQIFALESSTIENQSAARIQAIWTEATHATRKAALILTAYDTAEREGIRIGANGSAATLGLLGATPSAQLAHVADVKGDYVVGDLDSEAEIISMANALAAAINSLNALVETFGLRSSA